MSTGIEEISDVLDFVKAFAHTLKDAKSDGTINMFDAMKALNLAPSLLSAVRGAGNIKAEFADLTGEEKDILLNELKEAIYLLIDAVA